MLVHLLLACRPSQPPADGASRDTSGTTDSLPGDSADSTVPDTTDTGGTDTTAPPEDPIFDDRHLLVVSSMNRVEGFASTGALVHGWDVNGFVTYTTCAAGECRAEGVTADGDGLLVNWAYQSAETVGGLLRVEPSGGELVTDWESDGWLYPHEVARDGDLLVVADSHLDGLYWVADDGSPIPEEAVAAIDADDTSEFDGHKPNGMSRLEQEGRTWILVSYRSDSMEGQSQIGRIALWDVTDRDRPALAWLHPATGTLGAPHDPSLHWRDGRWLLLYAHSKGRDRGGSIGVAELSDLGSQPTYLADLVAPGDPFAYPRGACLTGDDRLYITDTGSDGGGAVFVAALPTGIVAPGLSGARAENDSEQRFIQLDGLDLFVDGFDETYRSFLWEPSI